MPLSELLTAERVVRLEAADRAGALRRLAEVALDGRPAINVEPVWRALEAREEELSTCIAPGIALPHTLIARLDRSQVAVGYSPAGIEWGAGGETIHLVVLLLVPESSVNEHIRLLAEIARLLRGGDVVNRIRRAGSDDEVRRILAVEPAGMLPSHDRRKDRINRMVLARAVGLAEDVAAAAVIVYADDEVDLAFLEAIPSPIRLLLASGHLVKHKTARERFAGAFEVPYIELSSEHRLEFTLLLAMSEGLIDSRDRVVCVWGRRRAGRLDCICAVDIAESFELLLSLQSELVAGDVNHYVLNRVLHLASCISREGREGKPVGTIFVLGQYEAVSAYCRQMVINPFKGYSDDQRNVLDPRLEETLKEFSVIDGAFVIRGDGVLMSAGTHLSAPLSELPLPSGLGARHTAAAAITAATRAVAIVISESTGTVSLYARGRAVMVLPREGR